MSVSPPISVLVLSSPLGHLCPCGSLLIMKIQNPELLKTWLIGKLEKMYDKLLVSLGSTRLVLYNGHRNDFVFL